MSLIGSVWTFLVLVFLVTQCFPVQMKEKLLSFMVTCLFAWR